MIGSAALARAIYAVPYPRLFSQHTGVGGHVAHVHGLVHGLADIGFRVDVLVEENHEVLEGMGIRVKAVPLGSSSLIRRQLWGATFGKAVAAAVRMEPAALCYMRYSAGFTPWIPRVARALNGVPLILEVNSLGSQRTGWLAPLDRRALRAARWIVCVSDPLRRFIIDEVDSDLASRVFVLPNGVAVSRFHLDLPAPRRDGVVHLAFAGLFKPHYGLDTLLAAYQLARRAHSGLVLDLYGDGPLRQQLRRRVEALRTAGAEVELHEPVPFLQMPQVLAGMDVLIYTTTPKYGFQSPIKLLEYMAAGKPIIAANTPQVRKLLRGGELGLLFQPGDANDLAAAIRAVLQEPEAAQARAARARAVAAAEHTWGHRVEALLRATGIPAPGERRPANPVVPGATGRSGL